MMKRKAPEASTVGEMRSEYRLDYAQSMPNRFAADMTPERILVVLDPDVAEVFSSSESVNDLLRSVIAALPQGPPRTRRPGKPRRPAPSRARRPGVRS